MDPIYRTERIHDKNPGRGAFVSLNGNTELVLFGIDKQFGRRNGIACLFQRMQGIFGRLAGTGTEID
jgi:hypothetical protein